MSATSTNVHVLAIDYHGFGTSTRWPSEAGLLTNTLTLVKFAMDTAGIPPERIVVFAQSMGTAVAISLTHHLASQPTPIAFAGVVLVAPFADVESLTRKYKVTRTLPLLPPLAVFPPLMTLLNGFILTKFPSKEKPAALVHWLDSIKVNNKLQNYDITLIYAEDDYDIPWSHSDILFWHTVNAASGSISYMTFEELEHVKAKEKTALGAGGCEMECKGMNGIIRE
ncbi:abhydrolase domain-containing protein 12 [Alternaria panax]|uniref:Abhydrolase domain-containing protein 12 n=1 Tax=Alternaria panax TaxID=48097 RepID=A0AAD4FKP1_9PLEO|nr:abhydrolase domain-containing protein 12 [Alternaria panax]